MDHVLEIKHLKTYFYTFDGIVPAVDDVCFHIDQGETLGLVGESGSGKSITALSILQLIPCPPGKILEGSIYFNDMNLLSCDKKQIKKIRGNQIAMIFQEPMTSLNPVFTIGDQIIEVLKLHQELRGEKARQKAVDLLKQVGIPAPEKRLNEYPHQLSGGMRQRAMIAIALSCSPRLLIADEPTTALDVTIQAQILDKINELKKMNNMSVLMITHDLGVIAEVCDRVIVMYAGRIVEQADVRSLFQMPLHPYTKGLLNSIPRLDSPKGNLPAIEGNVPAPTEYPEGCRFHPRCPYRKEHNGLCESIAPPLYPYNNREVACWEYWNEYEIRQYLTDLEAQGAKAALQKQLETAGIRNGGDI